MSRFNRRTNRDTLFSVVLDASTAVAIPTDCRATPTAPMPEGWFDEEVGYLSEMPTTLRIRTGMHGQRLD
ncbi:hypothetical protein [Paraburkholderia kirstenboschensis]|uniref:hypothetical protein n=1 Tax=Paraburkholderia kirstenboschensis TaxID=1245436 RepID=UPI0013E3E057|nr:hypothetical protein [Paraburkholderia kirstenboschensis]